MKRCSILLFVLVLSSCKLYKMIGEEKLTAVSDEMQLQIINSKLATNVAINDSVCKFLFDTGATSTNLTDTSLLRNFHLYDKAKFGTVKIGNSKRRSLDKISLTSKNELYTAVNEVVSILIPRKNTCHIPDYQGIMGVTYCTKDGGKILSLDFESLKAKILSEEQKQQLLSDYEEIKSEFFLFGKQIKIFLKINDIEESFHFDTGNSAVPFLIGPNSKLNFPDGIEYNGSIIAGADNLTTVDKNIIYNNANVTIGKETIKSMVFYNQAYKSKYNNVGLSFIKNFNWILDYKNKKVYYKQIKADFIKEVKPFQYRVYNTNDTLSINVKSSAAKAYNLGDQITSVNNVSVTPENICELQSLLNKTEDWNTLKLEVIPAKTKK